MCESRNDKRRARNSKRKPWYLRRVVWKVVVSIARFIATLWVLYSG